MHPVAKVALSRFQCRFGNQVFQYMFIKTYARRHGLHAEVPEWIGNQLFGTDDPTPSRRRPLVRERWHTSTLEAIIPNARHALADRALEGYFQYHTSYYSRFRDYIRELFEPAPAISAQVVPAWTRLTQQGRTVVGLHIRRGDYGSSCFYITPLEWYLGWLSQLWPTLERPVLFIATDDPSVVPAFAAYRPWTASSLGCQLPQAPYYPDFHLLSRCHYLAIPNSSFSFAAAMLNRRLVRAERSRLPSRGFERFDPWNDFPVYYDDDLLMYPDVPGTAASTTRPLVPPRVRRYVRGLKKAWRIATTHTGLALEFEKLKRG